MTIPMRQRAPVFSRSAPMRSVAIPMPDMSGWRPTPLRMKRGVKVLQLIPRLGRLNPGWLIASLIAELVLTEASVRVLLWANGLAFNRFCGLFPTQFFGYGATLSNCLTSQAASNPLRTLPQVVPTLPPGTYLHLLGLSNLIGGVIPRYSSNSIYVVTGSSYNGVRTRPFYGTSHRPFINSVAASYAAPGRVPFDVKPWPVGKYGNPPIGPQPIPDRPTYPPPPVPTRWDWAFPGGLPSTSTPSRTNPITRAPSRPWEKEVKIGANTPAAQFFFTLMKAREAVSELQDIVNVMFDSLPKHTQRRYGRNPTDHEKSVAVWENIEKMDAGLFLKNLVANQIEDEIIGRTWIAGRAKLRNKIFGNMIGSTGPLANGAFKEYAKQVSNLAKGMADGIMGEQDHAYERRMDELLHSTERALRDLRSAANQENQGVGQPRPRN